MPEGRKLMLVGVFRRVCVILFATLQYSAWPGVAITETTETCEARRPSGRVMALDFGTRRVGVAISDELQLTVRTLPALRRTNWKSLVRALAELQQSFDVRMVVFGLPLRLDGTEGDAATEARRLAHNLSLTLQLPVHLQDERLTSRAAEEHLRDEGFKRADIKQRVDSEAAAIILRDFLSEHQSPEAT